MNKPISPEEGEKNYQKYLTKCIEESLPNFASRTCYSCQKNIWSGERGTLDSFPTGCPYCYRSFVD